MAKIKLNRKKILSLPFHSIFFMRKILFFMHFYSTTKTKTKKKDDEISFLNQINILYVYHVYPYGVMFDLKNSIPKKKHMDKSNQYGISDREERK